MAISKYFIIFLQLSNKIIRVVNKATIISLSTNPKDIVYLSLFYKPQLCFAFMIGKNVSIEFSTG